MMATQALFGGEDNQEAMSAWLAYQATCVMSGSYAVGCDASLFLDDAVESIVGLASGLNAIPRQDDSVSADWLNPSTVRDALLITIAA